MTYHVGIGPGMEHIGYIPRDPYLTCDGCGVRYEIVKRGVCCAPTWLLNNRAPKGWSYRRLDAGRTQHYCPPCTKSRAGTPKPRRA